MTRSTFLKTAAASLGAVVLAACSTGPSDSATTSVGTPAASGSSSATGHFPVTVDHAYGSTTIAQEPKRVVATGWINAETVLALGVVPVGSGQVSWGGNANQSTDWFDAKLKDMGAAQPTRFAEKDGTNFEAIAKLNPDLIVAVVGTVSKEDYDKLSKIAPTVVHSADSDGWTSPWQAYTKTIGKALGREEAAGKLVADTEKKISDAAARHPQLKGATFIASSLGVTNNEPSISIYTNGDNRPQFLKSLGMTEAEAVRDAKASSFYLTWSNEKAADLRADMLYSWIDKETDADAIKANAVFQQIPPVAKNAAVLDANKNDTLAMNSALGLSWLVDHSDFVQKVADAVAQGKH